MYRNHEGGRQSKVINVFEISFIFDVQTRFGRNMYDISYIFEVKYINLKDCI